ncbi:RloB family protein [Actinomyces wuliandei]|uniref:RloB family protein n=1 Tax=Actinomyces wuliandei TaxID=2057743 RepID=UPI000FDCA389|nr:RloB family protein [Actinomyces wuliandei]
MGPRQPRPHRGRTDRQQRRTVLIVTNGRQTEKMYLDHVKQQVSRDVSVTTRFINGDPLTLIKELQRPRTDLSAYREVWIVVDQDGQDCSKFLRGCQSLNTRTTEAHGVISVPCFEVWLNAHYGPVRNYQNQADAQYHYRELTGLSARQEKLVPRDFPWAEAQAAAQRCFLPSDGLPGLDTQPSRSATTMPHLLHSLRLVDLKN